MSSDRPQPILEADNVYVEYRGTPPVKAVRGVSLALYPGEVVGLVGESGCGKSTMARVLTGLLKPNRGEVTYRGQPLRPLGLGRRPLAETGIQMVFQDPGSSLNPRRRVEAQIADGLRIAVRRGALGLADEGSGEHSDEASGERSGQRPNSGGPSTPAEWLVRVGMEADDARRYPRSFSGGQRQRIAAARALAARPDVLVADEPISALDASTQARVAYLMTTLAARQGTSLLFISHDLSVVRLIADRLVVMYAGRVVERGPTEQVWNDPRHPYTKSLLAAIPVPDGAGKLPAVGPAGEIYPDHEATR
ncbi:MAG: ATP-binding cassette domain-containing protein [Bifidobacteriaceae bacterium]|nr:ATP-binding cassette domain-containing protein [Bifidobacteriaceae bacterium]